MDLAGAKAAESEEMQIHRNFVGVKLYKGVLMQKIIRSEFSIYIIVGFVTTLLNYATYFIILCITDQSVIVSNVMAWAIAVTFSYIMNKKFVFISKNQRVIPEFLSFLSGRVLSGFIETLIIVLLINSAVLPYAPAKISASILAAVLNYFVSRYCVFIVRENI